MTHTKLEVSDSFGHFIAKSKADCKISKLIYSYFYHWDLPMRELIATGEDINYLTIRKDGTISYLPKGKKLTYDATGERWGLENRQSGKPAKVIRKIFTSSALRTLTDSDFEKFNNLFKSTFATNHLEFQLREDIANVYEMERTYVADSSLQKSCMNNESECVSFYEEFGGVSVLCLIDKNTGYLSGRALVWNVQIDGKDCKYMDRIYISHEYYWELFLDYAKQNNMYYKTNYKSYLDKREITAPNGDKLLLDLYVKGNIEKGRKYPYIDTFTFGNDEGLGNVKKYEYKYEYNCTDGTREGEEPEGIYDELEDRYIDEDIAVQITAGRYAGRTTHVDNTVELDGEVYAISDNENICIPYRRNEYFLVSDCVYSEYHDEWIAEVDAYEVCGEYYHENDVTKL